MALVRLFDLLEDKINANQRLAALLEEEVATLFFARFVDFVGVEKFEASEIGPLPRGWSAGTIGDIGELHREFLRGPSQLPYIGLDLVLRSGRQAAGPSPRLLPTQTLAVRRSRGARPGWVLVVQGRESGPDTVDLRAGHLLVDEVGGASASTGDPVPLVSDR